MDATTEAKILFLTTMLIIFGLVIYANWYINKQNRKKKGGL